MKNMRIFAAMIAAGSALASGVAQAEVLQVAAGGGAQGRPRAAPIEAKAGDGVPRGVGRLEGPRRLAREPPCCSLRGAARDASVLSFDGQTAGSDGLLITGDGAVLEDFSVENSKGNGVKAKGVDGITFRRLRVEWTGGPKETNGAYGVYPVSSKNVLIEQVLVKGASDAGIYVGQSSGIIVRNNEAALNVAGIEIENSYFADVHDNLAHHNTGGILVFDLPGLPQMGGHSIRVFHNRVIDNDTANFAPKGNIVASVPTGTGVMIMANRNVHVFDNTIEGNASAAVMLVAYVNAFTDPTYNPLPRDVAVSGNHYGRNGFSPKFPGGEQLAQAVGGTLPPVMWDGVTRFKRPDGSASPDGVRIVSRDGPVLNLNLKDQGASMATAQPSVTATLGAGDLPQPAPVVLAGGR